MSRHGLPFAIALIAVVGGCQNAWRGTDSYTQLPSGLEQPNSLIEFPSAVARDSDPQPSEVRQANVQPEDASNAVVLASNEAPAFKPSRHVLDGMLEEAGEMLRGASSTQDPQLQQDYLNQAAMKYEQVLQQDPENAVAHHRMGVVGDLKRDFLSAETHYRRALKQTPHSPDLLSDIGYSYQLQERFDVAEKFLNRALEINPSHSRAANNLGKLAAERGAYDEAYSLFKRAGSPEHAEKAMAYFFPDGPPPEDKIANTLQPVVSAAADSANTFSNMTATGPAATVQQTARAVTSEVAQTVDQQAQAALEHLQTVQEELRQQLQADNGPALPQIRTDLVTEDARDAFNTHPNLDKPIVRPRPGPGSGLTSAAPATATDTASVMSAALKPVPPAQPQVQFQPPPRAQFQEQPQQPKIQSPPRTQLQFQSQPTQRAATSGVPWRTVSPARTYSLQAAAPVSAAPTTTIPTPTAPTPAAQARPPIALPTRSVQAKAYPIADENGLWNAQPVDRSSLQQMPSERKPAPKVKQQVQAPTGEPLQYPYANIINEPPRPKIQQASMEAPQPPASTGSVIQMWPGLDQSQGHSAAPATYPQGEAIRVPSLPPAAEYEPPPSTPKYEPIAPRQAPVRAVYPKTISEPPALPSRTEALPTINPRR
jgi:tetratricopeptide (TPR) repeat protein